VNLLSEMQKTAITNGSCLINIHGAKSSGKSVFIEELARILLERG
jgi:uridine kinase